MNTKNNQRFCDSEIRMEAAMLKLMKETEFKKITVKMICETAMVNRTTFYAHFTDIYDMLDKTETFLQQELLQSYKEINGEMLSDTPLIIFLKHIKKHQYFYRIALQTRKEFSLKQGFEPLWNQLVKSRCENIAVSEKEMTYYFIYFQAGFTMLLKHWLDTDCKESESEFAEIIRKCIPISLCAGYKI